MAQLSRGDAFAMAVGRALWSWQNVETAMYYGVHCILGTRQEYSAAMYHAIRSPQTKVSLADNLWKLKLSEDEFRQHASPVFKLVDRLRLERDNVAHFQAQGFADEKMQPDYRMYVTYTDPSYGKKYEYRTADLLHLCDEMREATDALNQLTYRYYDGAAFPKTPRELLLQRPKKRPHTRSDRK